MEQAIRSSLASLARRAAERRDLEIISKNADKLNAEAEDVLGYQVPMRDALNYTGSRRAVRDGVQPKKSS